MGIVLCLHLLLACGFMLYFFHVPPTSGAAGPTTVTEVVTKEGEPVQGQEVNKEETPVKASTSEKRSLSKAAGGNLDQQMPEDSGGDKLPEQVDEKASVEVNDGDVKSEEESPKKQKTDEESEKKTD